MRGHVEGNVSHGKFKTLHKSLEGPGPLQELQVGFGSNAIILSIYMERITSLYQVDLGGPS